MSNICSRIPPLGNINNKEESNSLIKAAKHRPPVHHGPQL
jgi:hypothetical protein